MYFGPWNPGNPALAKVIRWMLTRPPPHQRIGWGRSRLHIRDASKEIDYVRDVRQLTRKIYREFAAKINPHGHELGPSGNAEAYQVDHIVPVGLCWIYRVTVRQASHWRNLQVIPWRVNLARGLVPEKMIGWPGWQNAANQLRVPMRRDPSNEVPRLVYTFRKITLRNHSEWTAHRRN